MHEFIDKEVEDEDDEKKANLIIPKSEIKRLEKARVDLWDFADRHKFNPMQRSELESITSVMYRIANKKWPENV